MAAERKALTDLVASACGAEDENGRQTHFAQSSHNALKAFFDGIAQKLQSSMPGFRRRPAEPVPVRSRG